ncbi:MAG: Cellulosome-anchoring protein precursor [Pelotomaculum sp. PtaU1.Bin065]|nr:MAG: Cellulosome-anchoring protein precursor [Pelotomaculum sp. PtaU1.Bin065]
MEGQYTIAIGADGLAAPVDFFFKVAKSGEPAADSPGGGGGGGGVVTTPPAVVSSTGTATVAPAAGGTVSLGGEAAVEIPAGALAGTDEIEIEVRRIDTPPAVPAGFRLAGGVYEFSVGGESSYSFAKDVTIKLSFDPDMVGAGEIPAIEYYDENQGQWVNLGGTVSGNTVSVRVNHFTKFAVMAVENAEAALAAAFNDIAGHWAYDNINKLVALDAVSGYPDGSFKPDNTITRAEFATALVKAFQLADNGGKTFADTAAHWAKDYVAAAAASGIVSGYDADTFGPDDLITREQMAVMIVKAAGSAPAAGESQFSDSGGISGWAADAVAAATENGIIKGYPDNTFRPQSSATRAEAVTVVVNALNR